MDDTTQNRTSDVASAATRKRRSSILKSQRPPRTPFCELEFNVSSHTETNNSRRVSFSRRTGVAEFVRNEGTTTWKNFYEELNKSLETSGNESEGKQLVAHLGKRIFDQQFEEVKADDFIGTLNPGFNISASINNMDFAHVECTDSKLIAPHSNFELSACTETQSKLFRDDLAITCAGEVTDNIDVNFSAIQQIGKIDDLEEIEKDLQRQINMAGSQGPFPRQNLSEYIEVDLNMTHVAIDIHESDMSITDTIHSPKVQNVPKSTSLDKKNNLVEKDWVVDKENIMVNPYVAPPESLNFAVNEESDKVLVFDGKKLIVETENPRNENYRKTLLPYPAESVPQRKTIVLNCNDDLPNFINESHGSKSTSSLAHRPTHYDSEDKQNKQKTIIFDDLCDITITQAIPNVIKIAEKRRTIVYDGEIENISITQALPSNIIDKEKMRTVVYEDDNDNISITQAVPPNILIPNECNEKRKTIVFENEACNISMTQAIPANIIIPEKQTSATRTISLEDSTANIPITQPLLNSNKENKVRKTVGCEDIFENISGTHSIPAKVNFIQNVPERKHTVVFESGIDDIAVKQLLHSNIVPRNLNTTTYDNDGNVSMTQAVSANILLTNNTEPNRRKTILYEGDTGNLSITQAVSKNQVIQILAHPVLDPSDKDAGTDEDLHSKKVSSDENRHACVNQILPQQQNSGDQEEVIENRRRTIVFQNHAADVSITQAVPVRQVLDNINVQKSKEIDENVMETNKRKTIVFESDDADISMTQAITMNHVIYAQNEITNIGTTNKDNFSRSINIDNNDVDMSMTISVPMNGVTEVSNTAEEELTNRRKTVLFEYNEADIYVTQAVPMSQVIDAINERKHCFFQTNATHNELTSKQNDAELSMTQAVPMSVVIESPEKNKCNIVTPHDLLQNEASSYRRKTVIFKDDEADISMTQAVPMNQVLKLIKEHDQNIEIDLNKIDKEQTETDEDVERRQKEDFDVQMVLHNEVIRIESQSVLANVEDYNTLKAQAVQLIDQDIRGLHNASEHVNTQNKSQNNSSKDLTCFDTTNVTRHVVYDDDEGDISSSIILPDGQEKKRTIVVESVKSLLENKDLFMDLDIQNKTNNKDIELENNDISMTDVSDMETLGIKKAIGYEIEDDSSVVKKILDNLTLKNQDKSQPVKFGDVTTLSKPIPIELASFQKGPLEKCPTKNITRLDELVGKTTNAISEVFVYQTISANIQNLTQEKSFLENNTGKEKTTSEKRNSSECSTVVNTEGKHVEHMKNESFQADLDRKKYNKVCFADPIGFKPKSSILNDLLDMSQSSLREVTKDMKLDDISDTCDGSAIVNQAGLKNPDNTMFFITKDSEDDCQSDKCKSPLITQPYIQESVNIEDNSPLCIQYKNENEPPIIQDLNDKLPILKNDMKENSVLQSKVSEQNRIEEFETDSKVSLDMSKRKSAKGFKTANDTKELLEMISDFTDKRQSIIPTLKEMEENEKVFEQIPIESRSSLENNMGSTKPEPICNLKRFSKALSREELMNNLSMASAVLQNHRNDFDDSDIADESINTPNETLRKSVRMNIDIIKKLTFDDSSSDKSVSSQTPLKKTAFGEVSYMADSSPKVKVIPQFMKNVSDGIKELMDDLVKPVTEAMPFNTSTLDRSLNRDPSTCSTQIQANLLTSSQIDLQTELFSNTNSVSDVNKLDSADMINEAVNRSKSRALRSPVKSLVESVMNDVEDKSVTTADFDDKSDKIAVAETKNYYIDTGNVLVFDHANPLNNVLLAPPAPYAIDIHRYNPIQSNDNLIEDKLGEIIKDAENLPDDRVTNQYRLELELDGEKLETLDKTDTRSVSSHTSKAMLIDHSTEPEFCKGKDMEVNTVIAMKENRQLLDASSSLTLVDDTMDRIRTVTSEDSVVIVADQSDTATSPAKHIYQVEEPSPKGMESDVTSTDDVEETRKPKKRVYSPAKREKHLHCTFSSLDATPVPVTKMQKRSLSPIHAEPNQQPMECEHSPELSVLQNESPTHIGGDNKPGTSVTVQQMMVHVQGVKEARDVLTSETASSEVTSSCTSSNSLRGDSSPRPSHDVSSNPSRTRWLPGTSSNSTMSCIDNPYEDIVAMINAMPFMGSNECRWECVGESGWTLVLLHARVRLTVRFAPAPSLRAHTPVLSTELEMLHLDKKNSIAYLCVSFACETMRCCVSRGCGSAGELAKLLRRLAATARLAAQWARSMHDAKARLAYSLSPDGWLALKVANTSLRTVWEVSMRLELVMESARAAPCPRACDVRVSCAPVPAAVSRLLAAVPHDWGHVPTTIWKLFRYLKHMKRDGDV